ncbi:MAG TPA: LysR family transcriptional regulator [Jatrophihabitans sp.]|jgi:DNA-binding transcriptional LysR family regulator|uniref:LysR family transcriptional regulator n=1 Tax=Jatrophihabitans sp. TaxID=1932789 RepID=UPI002F158C65
MLNPVWLQTLQAVIEFGSFADAARQLGYTPSAVSQQMSRLERSIGAPLFTRDGRRVIPTSAAIRLAERATAPLAMLSSLDLAEDTGDDVTPLRLGTCAGGLHYIRPALRQWAEDSPQVALSMTAGESSQLVEDVAVGALDVAVVCRYNLVPRIWPGQLANSLLANESLVVLLPASHPLARPWTAVSDMRHEWWITGPETSDESTALLRTCAAAGFEPRVAARVQDYEAAVELVLNGFGVTVAPATLDLASKNAGVVAIPVAGLPFRSVEVVRAATDDSIALANFIASLYPAAHGRSTAASDAEGRRMLGLPG